jgi:hypothetical protein
MEKIRLAFAVFFVSTIIGYLFFAAATLQIDFTEWQEYIKDYYYAFTGFLSIYLYLIFYEK